MIFFDSIIIVDQSSSYPLILLLFHVCPCDFPRTTDLIFESLLSLFGFVISFSPISLPPSGEYRRIGRSKIVGRKNGNKKIMETEFRRFTHGAIMNNARDGARRNFQNYRGRFMVDFRRQSIYSSGYSYKLY